jgi:hypothetical protein
MTDSHVSILRLIAQRHERELRNYDAVNHGCDPSAADWRRRLERAAGPVHASRAPTPGGANLAQTKRPDHGPHPRRGG